MTDQSERELVSRIDVGKQIGGEHEGCILINRSPSSPDLELVITVRDDGNAAIKVSPAEARQIGQAILDASARA